MQWSVKRLVNQGDLISFEDTISLDQQLQQRNEEVLGVKDVTVKGILIPETHGVLAQYDVMTVVTLPSSRSLEPVEVPIKAMVSERYVEPLYLTEATKEDDVVALPLEGDLLDLSQGIEDAILLALPLQVLSASEQKETATLPSGNDWAVIKEDQYLKEKSAKKADKIDPRLADLARFYDEDDETD